MELKMKQPEFRKKSLFERVIDNVADAIDTPPKYSGSAFWGARDDVQLPFYFHA